MLIHHYILKTNEYILHKVICNNNYYEILKSDIIDKNEFLISATKYNHIEYVKYCIPFVTKQININYAYKMANHYGYYEIVKILLENKSNIIFQYSINNTLYKASTEFVNLEMIKYLFKNEYIKDNIIIDNAMHLASSYDYTEIVEYLLTNLQ